MITNEYNTGAAIYLKRLQSLNRVCPRFRIGTTAQLMMFKLLDFFHKSGWGDWVSINNKALLTAVGCTSETTLLSARRELIQKGLIAYKRGWKGCPGQYRLLCDCQSGEFLGKGVRYE